MTEATVALLGSGTDSDPYYPDTSETEYCVKSIDEGVPECVIIY